MRSDHHSLYRFDRDHIRDLMRKVDIFEVEPLLLEHVEAGRFRRLLLLLLLFVLLRHDPVAIELNFSQAVGEREVACIFIKAVVVEMRHLDQQIRVSLKCHPGNSLEYQLLRVDILVVQECLPDLVELRRLHLLYYLGQKRFLFGGEQVNAASP